MDIKEAQAKFEAVGRTPANLYDVAYELCLQRGIDPFVTGDWDQARLLMQAVAGNQQEHTAEALSMWMLDSNMLSVAEVAERAGVLSGKRTYTEQYIRAEIGRGNLKAHRLGKRDWIISRRAFREWMNAPKRGSRAKVKAQ